MLWPRVNERSCVGGVGVILVVGVDICAFLSSLEVMATHVSLLSHHGIRV